MKKKCYKKIAAIFLLLIAVLGSLNNQQVEIASAKTVKKQTKHHKNKTHKQKKDKKHHKKHHHKSFKENENYFKVTDQQHLNFKPKEVYKLKGLYSRVVQKHYENKKGLYVLQVNLNTISVRKGKKHSGKVTFPSKKKAMEIVNGGHTQTWEDAGDGSHWLMGTTPKRDKKNSEFSWTTEIAWVKFKHARYYNHKFTRLTNLHAASDDQNYNENKLQRVEAAVSPNHHYLLISSIQSPASKNSLQTIHFGLYNLKEINQKLSEAEKAGHKTVSLTSIKAIDTFHLPNIFGKKGKIDSVQGIAISNKKEIYLSSEHLPELKGHYYRTNFPREIIKIPWKSTKPSEWTYAKLNHSSWRKAATELEGMQLTDHGFYITVAFHNPKNYLVYKNIIYKIPKF